MALTDDNLNSSSRTSPPCSWRCCVASGRVSKRCTFPSFTTTQRRITQRGRSTSSAELLHRRSVSGILFSFVLGLAVVLSAPVDAWLSWSPEGDRFVYPNYPLGNMFVVNAYTEQSVLLGPGVRPDWSPVDDRIIYQHIGEVFIVQPDGSNLRRIADTDGGLLLGWSPDGTQYALSKSSERYVEEYETLWDIFSIFIRDINGEDVREIVLGYHDYGVGNWGPLGITVYSVQGWTPRMSERTSACILDPESENKSGRSCSGSVDWTLDGRSACSWYGYFVGDWGEYTGWISAENENGEKIRVVDGLLSLSGLSWSPDGKSLAFDLELSDGTRELFIAEGERLETVRQITFDEQWNTRPEWSPNEDVIVYQHRTGPRITGYSLRFISPNEPTNVRLRSWGDIKRQGE